MNAHEHDAAVSPLAVAGGTLLGLIFGGLTFMIAAPLLWSIPETMAESTFTAVVFRVFAGMVIGGLGGLVIGGCMAWHAGAISAAHDRADSAPLWGLLTGGAMGLFLGPVFGFVLGFVFDYGAEGAILGLVLFPFAGLLSWQATYWLTDFERGERTRQA